MKCTECNETVETLDSNGRCKLCAVAAINHGHFNPEVESHGHIYSEPRCRCGSCGPAITLREVPNTSKTAFTALANGEETNYVVRHYINAWEVRKTDGFLYGGDLFKTYRTRRDALLYIKDSMK